MLAKSKQRLICGVHNWISWRRVGVKWPWIYRLVRIIGFLGLVRLVGGVRVVLRIVFGHEKLSAK
jgi:hypothetical protein